MICPPPPPPPIARWLDIVRPADASGHTRLRWAEAPEAHVIGGDNKHPDLRDYWWQIFEAECILESVQLLPILQEPLHRDNGTRDNKERMFYLHTLGKSAAGEA